MLLSTLLDMLADGTVIVGGWVAIGWLISNWNIKEAIVRNLQWTR